MTSEQKETKSSSQETEFIDEKMKKEMGYDMYPERKSVFKPSWSGIFTMTEGKETARKLSCEKKVYNQILKSPAVQLMMGALKSSGCPIDIRRHISCETCDESVHGGYDPILNQIVVCQNTANSEGFVQGVLTHEMIHMFDACNHKFDYNNLEHVACTEIRAANMTHCTWLSGFIRNDFGYFKLRKAHQDCVKKKAYLSLAAVRNLTEADAITIIDKVFDRCYNDLEPMGRRVRRNSAEMDMAFEEGKNFGYLS